MTQVMKIHRKILHIFGRMNRGGAEMRTLDVMRHIDPSEFQLDYCVLSGLSGDLDDEIRSLGGEIHYLPLRSPGFSKRFLHLLNQEGYDVVHSHVHYSSGFMLTLAARAGTVVRIAHFRSGDDGRGNNLRRKSQRRVMRGLINRYATQILAVSGAAMEGAWGKKWRVDTRCHIIYNGIDLTQFPPKFDDQGVKAEFGLPADAVLYIHVGRFDPEKNHARLLAMFADIARKDPRALLLLVGRGGNEQEHLARSLVDHYQLQQRVTFAGVRSDVPRLLTAADMMLFPSLWEGLPGAVLEASAAGRPVLATALPVIEEISPHLPLLCYLPLGETDTVWSECALRLCKEGKVPVVRRQAMQAFAESPFTIQNAVEKHEILWRGYFL